MTDRPALLQGRGARTPDAWAASSRRAILGARFQSGSDRGAMRIQESIESKLASEFSPAHLEVANESGNHSVAPGSETHFRVVVVSEQFADDSRIARHRKVHALLAEELAGGVHALAIQAHTPAEWTARGGSVRPSPDCRGGAGK
jgi:BolA protein